MCAYSRSDDSSNPEPGAAMDDDLLSPLEILAEAVEMAFEPGAEEVRALRSILDFALFTRSDASVRDAHEIYTQLDKPIRDRIEAHAITLATIRKRVNRG